MSKNLETEYKALQNTEADAVDADALWNKIEAALPAKNPVIVPMTPTTTPKKIKWYRNSRVITPLASVAVLAIVMITVFWNPSDMRMDSFTAGNMEISNITLPERYDAVEAPAAEAAQEDEMLTNKDIMLEGASNSTSATVGEETEDLDPGFFLNKETIQFKVLEEQDDAYLCIVDGENQILENGRLFRLQKDDRLQMTQQTYSLLLEWVERDEEPLFILSDDNF